MKHLRELTGAGVMECRRALSECNEDVAAAEAWLKERNKAVARSKSSRAADAGLVGVLIAPDMHRGALAAVRVETDFVARNGEFQAAVRAVAGKVLGGEPVGAGDVLDVAAKVRENVVLGETATLEVAPGPGNAVGAYVHNRLGDGVGTIAALAAVEGAKSADDARELAYRLALHVVAANPAYASREDVPADVRAAEEAKIRLDPAVAGKPANVQANVVKGKLQKFFAEVCVLDQAVQVGELEGTPIKDLLKGATLKGFKRVQIAGSK